MIGLPTITTSSTRCVLDPGAGEQLTDQFVDRFAHGRRQLAITTGVHHHVRHPAHQVLAEADLRVHPPAAGEDVAAEQGAEVASDGRRADVDRDAVGLVDESRPDGDDLATADGHRRRATSERPVDDRQHGRGDRRDPLAVLVGDCSGQQLGGGQPGAELGGGDLDVAEGEQRVDDELGQVELA